MKPLKVAFVLVAILTLFTLASTEAKATGRGALVQRTVTRRGFFRPFAQIQRTTVAPIRQQVPRDANPFAPEVLYQ